jgi:hypothetical protein
VPLLHGLDVEIEVLDAAREGRSVGLNDENVALLDLEVRARPSPTMRRLAIVITTGSEKPARASVGVSTPLNPSASTTRKPVTSIHTQPLAMAATAMTTNAKTTAVS